MIEMAEDLRRAVVHAARRPDVREAVAALYADLHREIDRRRPVCIVSGRCCRFEEFGHRLYVTTMELAAFQHGLERLDAVPRWNGHGCPFQKDRLCGVHAIRPFGCRVFFCDPASTGWQEAQYERFHAELKAMHERLEVPYFYLEWRAAMQALGHGG